MKIEPIKKVLVYLSNGEVKRIEGKEAFYKEEILERPGEASITLVDCFFAVAEVNNVPTGKVNGQ